MTPRARAVLAGVLLLVLAGCGVPTGGAPTTIAPSDVPYGLAVPSATATPTPTAPPVSERSRVFLVGEDRLVPRGRELAGVGSQQRLGQLLTALADGPTAQERDERLSTALPPDVRLSVGDIAEGTATVDIAGPVDAQSGWSSRRAVAQIVLTATSVPGIDAVRLTLAGEPVEAPLPGGELTTRPLTAIDYAVFVTGPFPSVNSLAPEPLVPLPVPEDASTGGVPAGPS